MTIEEWVLSCRLAIGWGLPIGQVGIGAVLHQMFVAIADAELLSLKGRLWYRSQA